MTITLQNRKRCVWWIKENKKDKSVCVCVCVCVSQQYLSIDEGQEEDWNAADHISQQ